MKNKLKGLMTSNTNEWYTPQKLYDELNKEFKFTLDPCCTKESAKCNNYFTKDDDGLTMSWCDHVVFMNPPYGREIGKWIQKAWLESITGATVVCLIPSRTDTRYWHDYIFPKTNDIRFLRGRIKFEREDGTKAKTAPFPSAIVVFSSKTLLN